VRGARHFCVTPPASAAKGPTNFRISAPGARGRRTTK
jgi:hypothetical protein